MNTPPLAFEKPTQENEKLLFSKSFLISSDKNKEYNVLFECFGNKLSISAETKSEEKNIFRNYFSFVEIQKVKFFLAYDTLEECVLEIFNFLEINKGFIKEKDSKIYLVIPLNSKKYPEIVFHLILKEKTDSEKIQELYSIIHKLKKEKDEQKLEFEKFKKETQLEFEKLKNMLYNDMKIIGIKEETKGISIELSVLGEEQFNKFINIEKEIKELYLLISFNFKVKDINKIHEIQKFFKQNESIIKNLIPNSKIKFRKNENNIFLDIFLLIEKNDDLDNVKVAFLQSLKSLHIYEFNNIKINLNSNFKIKHLFEKISPDFFLNELLQFQFFIKGFTFQSKFALFNIIDLIKEKNKDVNNKNILDLIKGYLFFTRNNFEFFISEDLKKLILKDILKASSKNEKIIFDEESIKIAKEMFGNLNLLKNINFDEFSIIISLPLNVKIAIESKFKIEGANEIFNSKFLDDKNNIYDYNKKVSLEDF